MTPLDPAVPATLPSAALAKDPPRKIGDPRPPPLPQLRLIPNPNLLTHPDPSSPGGPRECRDPSHHHPARFWRHREILGARSYGNHVRPFPFPFPLFTLFPALSPQFPFYPRPRIHAGRTDTDQAPWFHARLSRVRYSTTTLTKLNAHGEATAPFIARRQPKTKTSRPRPILTDKAYRRVKSP